MRRPPVFGIEIQRSGWDAIAKTTVRNTNHLQLEDTIYLDRYMHSEDPAVVNNKELKLQYKKDKAKLERERAILNHSINDMDVPTTFHEATNYLTTLKSAFESDPNAPAITDNLLDALKSKAAELDNLSADIDRHIASLNAKLNAQFADMQDAPYKLYAICVHRGGTGAGHYWAYINDFEHGVWRKYNDERVETVTDVKAAIFEPATGVTYGATPTYVLYIRDDMKDSIAGPVCRAITDGEEGGEIKE
jgi:ubiquitin carboxyl-terminal hydrolase 25